MRTVRYLLAAIALLAIAVPAAAKTKEPIGERISLYWGEVTFSAGQPFNIRHGHAIGQERDFPPSAIGRYDFRLELDGVPHAEDCVDRAVSHSQDEPPGFTILWVHNFPDGMTGTHTFTGRWFAPCQSAVATGSYPGPCAFPAEQVLIGTQTLIVHFE